MNKDCPRIWVGCLAAYNSGKLHGRWIDLDGKDADDVLAEIRLILKDSPAQDAEEWTVRDYDGFGGIRLGEHPDLEQLVELARLIEEHGESYRLYAENEGVEYATEEQFQDRYRGCYKSVEDYANQYLYDTGAFEGIPGWIEPYFDVDAFARDMVLGGDIYTMDGREGTHIYSNC